jgi:glycosyltransferase involved in cell wall biosynthesis
MKICYLVNELAPAGAQTLLLDLVRHTDADIDYTVCFIEGDDHLVSDFESAGARVVDFGAAFKFDPRALARMARFFRRERFDVLHAHLPYSQTLGRVFGRLGGIETIVSTQHSAPNNYHPLSRFLERATRPIDERTIAVSKAVERLFTATARHSAAGRHNQWCTIHNGIDAEAFAAAVQAADATAIRTEWAIDGDPVFLNVGRYRPQKAQRRLIEAMPRVLDELPDAHLLVVGWGELEDDLRTATRRYGLTDSVTITGRVPMIYPYYGVADAFVLSSVRESFGIVLLEAMAAGLPVVATDVQGVPEIVDHGRTGLLVPPDSPDELADAMIRTVRTNHQYGQHGYERVREAFDIRQTTASHVQLYEKLYDSSQ